MTSNKLDELVENETIKSYKYVEVDCRGIEGPPIGSGDSERLIIEFTNGEKLKIDTCCSGCSGNVIMIIS